MDFRSLVVSGIHMPCCLANKERKEGRRSGKYIQKNFQVPFTAPEALFIKIPVADDTFLHIRVRIDKFHKDFDFLAVHSLSATNYLNFGNFRAFVVFYKCYLKNLDEQSFNLKFSEMSVFIPHCFYIRQTFHILNSEVMKNSFDFLYTKPATRLSV